MASGYLRLVFLRYIEQKQKGTTGYELMKYLEDIVGKKPSPGSTYPLLSSLVKDEYLKVNKQGNKKIYTITKKGKKYLKEIAKEKKKIYDSQRKILLLLSDLDAVKKINYADTELNKYKRNLNNNNPIIIRTIDSLIEIKDVLERIFINQDLDKKKIDQLDKILKETAKKLKKIEGKK